MSIPSDDLTRALTLAASDGPGRHISVAGGTYTILVTGQDTAGRYCLIDMYVPPQGGPPPHRHDFEESFTVLEGEIEATFRGKTVTVKSGQVINIPANAPHRFQNRLDQPARLLCFCAPAGQDDYFLEVGIPVDSRTAPGPKTDPSREAEMKHKAEALASKYKTEFLREA